MVYCMNYLIEKLEEEKLECLCKLLTTIGEQVESEVREPLDNVFKKMQDIVERKSNKISSRVRCLTYFGTIFKSLIMMIQVFTKYTPIVDL